MPLITISCLGKRGRAGNAMFQYAFAKGYALATGCDLETNDWWGRHIFANATEPLCKHKLRSTICDSVFKEGPRAPGYFLGEKDIDLFGYFQHQKFVDYYLRMQVREWFKLKPEFELYAPFEPLNHPYNAKHLRRGDYTQDPTFRKLYCTVSEDSYFKAARKFKLGPVIRVYDGCLNPPNETLKALGVEWLIDWLVLREAENLLRSNSTFAWWAAALGHGNVYSPVVGKLVGEQDVEFVEGNWPNTAGMFHNQSDLHLKE